MDILPICLKFAPNVARQITNTIALSNKKYMRYMLTSLKSRYQISRFPALLLFIVGFTKKCQIVIFTLLKDRSKKVCSRLFFALGSLGVYEQQGIIFPGQCFSKNNGQTKARNSVNLNTSRANLLLQPRHTPMPCENLGGIRRNARLTSFVIRRFSNNIQIIIYKYL